MQQYFDTVQDKYGNALSGTSVSVYNSLGALATLYSDNGVTTRSNPVTTDSLGNFSFYAPNGVYSLTYTLAAYGAVSKSGITLYDPSTVTTLEMYGAKGSGNLSDMAADTAALALASAIPNAIVVGDPTKTYYISTGVACASGVKFRNCRFKIKLGASGFSSVDTGITTRYSTTTTLLYWLNSEGGGVDDCEFFGDGGGDYVCQPVAVRGGMTTKPFVCNGANTFHDLPGVTNCFSIHGIGKAGAPINTLFFQNIGTTKSSGAADSYGAQGYWTNNGAYSGITQVSCFVVDTDCLSTTTSYGVDVKRIVGQNIWVGGAAYAKNGWQSDLVTIGRNSLAGAGENGHGVRIAQIVADDVNEVVDSQQENVWIGSIVANRVAACFKQGYMGANSKCDSISVDNLALWAAVLYGGSSGPVADLNGVYVGQITGRNVGGYTIESGNASASTTASNFVLGTYSSPYSGVDNYYSQGPYKGGIYITGGTGSGQLRAFTGYTASTHTCTGLQDAESGLSSNWSVTPDATSTYVIVPYARIFGGAIITDSTSSVKNSTIDNIALFDNLNRLTYIAYGNSSDVTRNNRINVARDFGFTLGFCSVPTVGPLRVSGGPAVKAFCQMVLAGGDQTVSSTSATLVLFGTKRQDTYDIPGSQGVQGSAAENGIRVRSPGPKTFVVKLGWSSFTAAATCKVSIYRNGSEVESKTFTAPTGAGSGPFNTDVTFRLYHGESAKDFRNGGGNENLYQVYVTNSVTGMVLQSSTASCTTSFTVEG